MENNHDIQDIWGIIVIKAVVLVLMHFNPNMVRF